MKEKDVRRKERLERFVRKVCCNEMKQEQNVINTVKMQIISVRDNGNSR